MLLLEGTPAFHFFPRLRRFQRFVRAWPRFSETSKRALRIAHVFCRYRKSTVIRVLSDNVDREEVERVEQDATNLLSNVLNVFSGTTKAPKPEAKICRRSSFKKLTCTVLAADCHPAYRRCQLHRRFPVTSHFFAIPVISAKVKYTVIRAAPQDYVKTAFTRDL